MFLALNGFKKTEAVLKNNTRFKKCFGPEEASRQTLAFIYDGFDRWHRGASKSKSSKTALVALDAELANPVWTYRAVANLQNFQSDLERADIGSGVSIEGRDFSRLKRLGFSNWHLQQLGDDWSEGMGSSSYVILVRIAIPKSPESVVLTPADPWILASNAIRALRLAAEGDVRMTRMWIIRPARARFGLGAAHSTGSTSSTFGRPYALDSTALRRARMVNAKLAAALPNAPSRFVLALTSYESAYDRLIHQAGSRVIDSVTALEAMVGEGSEIAFKLAYRVSSILASSDDERVELFRALKRFYTTRSRLVHGDKTKDADHQLILDDAPLRSVTRRMLVAFINLLAGGETINNSLYQELDTVLLHRQTREALRKRAGIK